MNRKLQATLHAGKFNALLYSLPGRYGIYGIILSSKYQSHPECSSEIIGYNIKIDWNKIAEQAEKEAREQLPDNLTYAFKYKPRIEWILPYLSAEYSRAGICCKCTGILLTRWFERFPEIQQHTRVNYYISPDQFADTSALFVELMKYHQTPHVDEILAQRAIAELLPQPIAEAIVECMRGVILRRWCAPSTDTYEYHAWNTVEACCDEVRFTYIDMYGETYKIKQFAELANKKLFTQKEVDLRTWEDTAAYIHANW